MVSSTGFFPSRLTNVNGTLFFRDSSGGTGYELWKSDGTAAGTMLVKDISAGSTSSNPSYFTNVNGVLYFRAEDGSNGEELWKSDGTSAGTVLVKDIRPGGYHAGILDLKNVNGKLFFTADSGVGRRVWVSDGTSAGTFNVSTGVPVGGIGDFYGRAVFAESNQQVWTSDGTAGGTQLLAISSPIFEPTSMLMATGDNLFATASNSAVGQELFRFDRTLSLSATATAENQSIGSVIGVLATADPSSENTFTYTLVNGLGDTHNSLFTIVGNELRSAASFDFETQPILSVRVRTTDQLGMSLREVLHHQCDECERDADRPLSISEHCRRE